MSVDYKLCRFLAKNVRKNLEYKGGIILIEDDKVYGWRDCLRDPQTEHPGVVAVDEDGRIWVARGGSNITGAEYWNEEDI